MGHPTDIFSSEPSASCICVICHDVLKDASSLQCGHTFCKECIDQSLESNDICPNCRALVEDDSIPNYVVRDIIGGMEVKCPHGEGGRHQDGDGDSNKKRKRDGTNDTDCCNWKGPLKDLKHHENNECGYKVVTCSVDGCTHSCLRKDMNSHISSPTGILLHMKLMAESYDEKIKSVQSACDKKVKQLEDRMTTASNHLKYENDCRIWKESKPDALFDFSMYSKMRYLFGDS